MRPIPHRGGNRLIALVIALSAVFVTAGLATADGQSAIAQVRQATAKYHDIDAAVADGYGPFYVCTEQPGIGAMGQHYVNGAFVEDPAIDPLRPEVLVYAPKRDGGYRLVALEYVTIAALWEAQFGSANPTVLGQDLHLVPEGNRYGLPDFYERHMWLWLGNPLGLFEDWNPNVSCLGEGDDGG